MNGCVTGCYLSFPEITHVKHGHKARLDDSISMFVGLDVHKNYLQVAVVDDRGILLKEKRTPDDVREIERFFADIDHANIEIESSSTWYHIYETLSKRYRVVLSNPVKTKAIASAKVKTDRIDALMLADLLRGVDCAMQGFDQISGKVVHFHKRSIVSRFSTMKFGLPFLMWHTTPPRLYESVAAQERVLRMPESTENRVD